MLRHHLQLYFILMFYISIEITCGISQKNPTTELTSASEDVPTEKCESEFCSCDDFLHFGSDGTFKNVSCVMKATKEAFKFNITNLNHFPPRVFEGINTSSLIIDLSNVTADEHFLEGMTALSDLEMTGRNLEIIPDFSFIKDSIQSITIRSSRIRSLTGKNLQNLASVIFLNFSDNFIQNIDADVFQGTENVQVLDLSQNLLTSIPSTLLDKMQNLTYFFANYNRLKSVDNLFSVTKPKVIGLAVNDIPTTSCLLHYNMAKEGKVCTLHSHHNHHYVYEGYDLDLSYNSIEEIPQSFFSCYTNLINGTPVFRVHRLRLSGNRLKALSSSLRYTEIFEIMLDTNNIQYLTAEDFLYVYDTTVLQLQYNQIRWIDTNTFKPLRRYLGLLNLSHNKFNSINGSVRYLSGLQFLNVSHNAIQFIADDEFTGLYNLTHLNLEYNQIKNIGQLQQLPLQNLNIIGNDIKLIKPDQLPETIRYIYFAGNPFNCDCQLQRFITWIKENDYLETDTSLCLDSDSGNNIQNLGSCPEMCSCRCTDFQDIPFMFVDCSSKNLSVVPQFFKHNITQIEGSEMIPFDERHPIVRDQNIYPFYFEDYVLSVSMEDNNLEYFDETQLPSNITHLYLSNNMLRWLPDFVFDNQLNLKEVSLSGNPWNCDCNSLKLHKWLKSKYNIILDIDNVRCGESNKILSNLNGRLIWNLTDGDLCPMTDGENISSSDNVGTTLTSKLCILFSVIFNLYIVSVTALVTF